MVYTLINTWEIIIKLAKYPHLWRKKYRYLIREDWRERRRYLIEEEDKFI